MQGWNNRIFAQVNKISGAEISKFRALRFQKSGAKFCEFMKIRNI